ncbi:hypothetical protein [Acidisoma sp. C75]
MLKVHGHDLRWQNTTVPPGARASGIFGLGLLLAWFFFVWLLSRQPGFAAASAAAPSLLRFVIDKGFYATDLGVILLAFLAFHAQRDLRLGWDGGAARRMYLRLLPPFLAYLVLSLVAFELAALFTAGHFANPWVSPVYGPLFRPMLVIVIGLALVPLAVCWAWVALLDLVYSALLVILVYYGTCFYFGAQKLAWLWSVHLPVAFLLGITCCSLFFRAGQYLSAVRGPMVLIGWFALVGGAILGGPFLFYLGFVMILAGAAMNERLEPGIAEAPLRGWGRTALGLMLATPAVLTLWDGMAGRLGLPLGAAALLLALMAQVLGLVFYLLAEPALAPLVRGRLLPPGQAGA